MNHPDYDQGPENPHVLISLLPPMEIVPSANVPRIIKSATPHSWQSYRTRIDHVPINVDLTRWLEEPWDAAPYEGVVPLHACGPKNEWPKFAHSQGTCLVELSTTVFPTLPRPQYFTIRLHLSAGLGAFVTSSFVNNHLFDSYFTDGPFPCGPNPFAIKWITTFAEPEYHNWTAGEGPNRTRSLPVIGKVSIKWRMWVYSNEVGRINSTYNQVSFHTEAWVTTETLCDRGLLHGLQDNGPGLVDLWVGTTGQPFYHQGTNFYDFPNNLCVHAHFWVRDYAENDPARTDFDQPRTFVIRTVRLSPAVDANDWTRPGGRALGSVTQFNPQWLAQTERLPDTICVDFAADGGWEHEHMSWTDYRYEHTIIPVEEISDDESEGDLIMYE